MYDISEYSQSVNFKILLLTVYNMLVNMILVQLFSGGKHILYV